MAVGLHTAEHIDSVEGIRLASCHAGIKQGGDRDDLVLVEINPQANVCAVFTTNKFCAAPVAVARRHLQQQLHTRYLLINSGNANAGTGTQGMQAAVNTCQAVAQFGNVDIVEVLPFSTGVIGQQLPVEKVETAIPGLFDNLMSENWLQAAKGIMTTDTLPKAVSRKVAIDGRDVTISGMCKGSGMIKPDMATMLAFIATDAEINQTELQFSLKQAVDCSFNAITVDGDTSTNDACVLIATGASGVPVNQQHQEFTQALKEVFILLAQSIVRDGEGASKFVEIRVEQAGSSDDAKAMAYTIAHSPLVKTALFASDANWGRILAAVGRAPIEQLDINKVNLYLGDVCLIEAGNPHPDYNEQRGQQEMNKQDIEIRVNLNLGKHSATVWTTDLSYDYVKINAEYRS
jgi:glutamate N-acetyltransferase/amino-acid N-acetyltransferase